MCCDLVFILPVIYDQNCQVPTRGVEGVIRQIFSNEIQHMIKNWTELDLRFCKYEGSKRSNINGKGGQLD